MIVVKSRLALPSAHGIVRRRSAQRQGVSGRVYISHVHRFRIGVYALDVAAATSLFFVLLELFAWRSGLGGDHSHAHAAHWPDSPSNPALAVAASGEGHRPAGNHPHARPDDRTGGEAKPNPEPKPKSMVLRVEADDLERAAASSRRRRGDGEEVGFERTLHHGGRTTGRVSRRLRRSQSPRRPGRILNDGSPFVTAVEWTP